MSELLLIDRSPSSEASSPSPGVPGGPPEASSLSPLLPWGRGEDSGGPTGAPSGGPLAALDIRLRLARFRSPPTTTFRLPRTLSCPPPNGHRSRLTPARYLQTLAATSSLRPDPTVLFVAGLGGVGPDWSLCSSRPRSFRQSSRLLDSSVPMFHLWHVSYLLIATVSPSPQATVFSHLRSPSPTQAPS